MVVEVAASHTHTHTHTPVWVKLSSSSGSLEGLSWDRSVGGNTESEPGSMPHHASGTGQIHSFFWWYFEVQGLRDSAVTEVREEQLRQGMQDRLACGPLLVSYSFTHPPLHGLSPQ